MAQEPKAKSKTRSASGSLRSLSKLLKVGSSSRKGGTPGSIASKNPRWQRAPIPEMLNLHTLPEVTWEPGMFTLDYIIRNLPLPRLIQCEHSACDRGTGVHGFDCAQPLMLYSKHVGLKVAAGGLAVNSGDGRTLVETDNRLLVSDEYKGWFAVLGSDMTETVIPHYVHVSQLAQSDCHTFLIGGTQNVKTVQKVGDDITESRDLCPGDILKMGVLGEDDNFLHCTDDNDRDVILPTRSPGVFFVLKYKTRTSKIPIQQIKDIVSTCTLPCIVKLVHGREPADAGVFSKVMVLEDVGEHTSLLTSTMIKTKNVLYELPVGIPNKFKVAVPRKNIFQSSGYISALNLCIDTGDRFMRGIRLFKHDEGALNRINRTSLMGMHLSSLFQDEDDPMNSQTHHLIPDKPTIRQMYLPVSPPGMPPATSNDLNGVSPPSSPSHSDTIDDRFALSVIEEVNNLTERNEDVSNKVNSISTESKSENLIMNGDTFHEAFSESDNATPKSKAPRPHAYDEIWSATSSGKNSASASIPSTPTREGMIGQMITSIKVSPESMSSEKHEKQFVRANSIEDVDADKTVPSPINLNGGTGSFNTSIDFGRESSASNTDDEPSTPDSERSMRRKTVSFNDEVDVHSIPQQHVTTVNINESPTGNSAKKHTLVTRLLPPIPVEEDTNNNSRRVVSFEDFELASSPTKDVMIPGNGEDEMGYMLPVFDRKGRVHSKSQRHQSKESGAKEEASKRLSLPILTVSGAYNSLEEPKANEADILY